MEFYFVNLSRCNANFNLKFSRASQDQMKLALAIPAFQIFGQLATQITVLPLLQYFGISYLQSHAILSKENSKWERNEFDWGVVWLERIVNFCCRGHTWRACPRTLFGHFNLQIKLSFFFEKLRFLFFELFKGAVFCDWFIILEKTKTIQNIGRCWAWTITEVDHQPDRNISVPTNLSRTVLSRQWAKKSQQTRLKWRILSTKCSARQTRPSALSPRTLCLLDK